MVKVETAPGFPAISFLSWDTEGGPRAQTNLLRAPARVRLLVGERWLESQNLPAKRMVEGLTTRYLMSTSNLELVWRVACSNGAWETGLQALRGECRRVELVLPFAPRVTPTTVLPTEWSDRGDFLLPVVLNAPDFGPVLLKESGGRRVGGRLEGSRRDKAIDLTLTLDGLSTTEQCTLVFSPLLLPAPSGLRDLSWWRRARRGWLNALQPCAKWGEQGKPFSAPPGILGNNALSDPASVSLWFYADQAFWIPEIAPGISVNPLVRRSIDYWLDHRMRRNERGELTGEITGYWDYGNFLDANAGPLIAAWDYVESSGDVAWLKRRIEQLERVADFLARRDVDGDGLIEATQSGNANSLRQPNRSCAWWDALNCGHKDGYCNALAYRAFCCLAALEGRLGRPPQRARYRDLAARLRSAYAATLYNPQTGWLAWWKSQDGQLHDYASPTLNGIAIEYGLVAPQQGREILGRLRAKMEEAGFRRFDLGVPPMLLPVRRSDYLLPEAIGCPQHEDGGDTFGQYMNGGITAGHVLHFLAAHYVVGEAAPADAILRAMLERQAWGGFQNGVQDAGGRGIDWTTWDGRPSGYEGYLADSFRFLQAVVLREPALRSRYYRPLLTAENAP
jgi:hypothetical protein